MKIFIFFITAFFTLNATSARSVANIIKINPKAQMELKDDVWETLNTKHIFKRRMGLIKSKNDPDLLITQTHTSIYNDKKIDVNRFFESKVCEQAKGSVDSTFKVISVVKHHQSDLGFSYCTVHFTHRDKSEIQLYFPSEFNSSHLTTGAVLFTLQSKAPESVNEHFKKLVASLSKRSSVSRGAE